VNKIREGIGDKIASFLQWTSCCICGVILGLVYGWKLALVTVAISPLLVVAGGLMTYVSTLMVFLWSPYVIGRPYIFFSDVVTHF